MRSYGITIIVFSRSVLSLSSVFHSYFFTYHLTIKCLLYILLLEREKEIEREREREIERDRVREREKKRVRVGRKN